ncbi:MAG: hypothetical protein ACXACA_06065 [Candidatus Ranarchaeia archaeon]|jgi:hypothetical protein
MSEFDWSKYKSVPAKKDDSGFNWEKYESKPREKDPISMGQALRIGLERGGTLGFRPVIAGLGAAAGSTIGELQQNRGLMDALRSGMEAFSEARKEAVEEEELASREAPITSALSEVLGSIPTAVLAPVGGLKGAAALGGVMGLGKGLSEAESLADIPGEVAKGALTGAAIEGTTKGLGAIARKAGRAVKEGTKTAVSKLGAATTGVPEKDIRTLMEKGDDVARIIKESGGDLTSEADNLRRNLMNAIQSTRKKSSKTISEAIQKSASTPVIKNDSAIQAAKNVAESLAEKAEAKDIKAINKLIVKNIEKSSVKDALTLKEAQALKQQFDTLSKDTYIQGGKVFANSAGIKRAAKAASNELRSSIAELSPEIAKSNKTLSKLHDIEKKINKNLIAEGKPDVSLFAAGSDTHKRNASMLRELGEITGTKPLEEAEKLAAARSFADTKLLPSDVTGKSLTRILASTSVGGAAGGPLGAAVGALAASPTALKYAIRSGQVTAKNAGKLFNIATPEVKSLLIQTFGKESFPGVDPAMQAFIEALRGSSRKVNKE